MPCRVPAVAACVLLAFACPRPVSAAGPFLGTGPELLRELPPLEQPDSAYREPRRLVAAALALTLGTVGAHRLYFGTDAKVPILYGLTFGGFGVLVLIDLGQILFTKDLAAYRQNNKVLMWSKGRSEELTPP